MQVRCSSNEWLDEKRSTCTSRLSVIGRFITCSCAHVSQLFYSVWRMGHCQYQLNQALLCMCILSRIADAEVPDYPHIWQMMIAMLHSNGQLSDRHRDKMSKTCCTAEDYWWWWTHVGREGSCFYWVSHVSIGLATYAPLIPRRGDPESQKNFRPTWAHTVLCETASPVLHRDQNRCEENTVHRADNAPWRSQAAVKRQSNHSCNHRPINQSPGFSKL